MPCWGKFINCRSEIIKVKLHKYTGVYNASAHVNFWLFFMRLPRQVEHKFTDSLWRHPEPRWRQSTHVSAINCVVHIVDTSALASHQPSTAIAVSVMQIKKNKTKRKTKHKHTYACTRRITMYVTGNYRKQTRVVSVAIVTAKKREFHYGNAPIFQHQIKREVKQTASTCCDYNQ